MRAFASSGWRKFGAILVVATYSLWSIGAFALNGRAFTQNPHGAHHSQVNIAGPAENPSDHAAHGHSVDAVHHDQMNGPDQVHSNDKSVNCCGAACIPALAADLMSCSFADRIASPIPVSRMTDGVADPAVGHYRPPISL